HNNRCVIDTNTLYEPIAKTPCNVYHPPRIIVMTNPHATAIRTIGTNAALTLIASLLLFLYALLSYRRRSNSYSSVVQLFIVEIPIILAAIRAPRYPACSLTFI